MSAPVMAFSEAGIHIWAPDGIGEIGAQTDLAAVVADGVRARLADGDIVVITSKVVSKAEGRVRPGDRDSAIADETVRLVARRGPTTIVRNRLGLTMAAAGVDASNVAAGSVVLLPLDPDASARRLRSDLARLTGRNVGVVITDTAGRAWREGQTDIAIGAAGLRAAESFAGRVDSYGNDLVVTLPAVIDEIAGACELATGKLGHRPVAVLRGRADLVRASGDDGDPAATLIRADGADLFGYGAREAVVRALVADPADADPFGTPVSAEELADVIRRVWPAAIISDQPDGLQITGSPSASGLAALCFAHGWVLDVRPQGLVARPR